MIQVTTSFHSIAGIKDKNEDFGGVSVPKGSDLIQKGICMLAADGVSGAPGGRDAAEYCGRNLLSDYFSTPDTWEISQSLERIFQALNQWILAQGRANQLLTGMATTLTSLVVRGAHYYFAHVGDSRLYLLRDGEMKCLTTDHVWQRPEMSHVLTRAIGIDRTLVVDHGMGVLKKDDVFLLLTDGVWASLPENEIRQLTLRPRNATEFEGLSRKLCEEALALGSRDNCTAVILRIEQLGEDRLSDALQSNTSLPVPRLAAGKIIDGMQVIEKIYQSRRTELFKVTIDGDRILALKTLSSEMAEDALERASLTHEIWLSNRLCTRFFAQVVKAPKETSALYLLTTFHSGQTLEKLLAAGRHFTIPEVINIGTQLARAIGALHRRGIIHRDIKPENVILDGDYELVVVDIGLAVTELGRIGNVDRKAGTPSYIAPELFSDGEITPSIDLYAWGVTMYQLLIGKFPYGEIEAFQTPSFGQPGSLLRSHPNIPGWLDSIVARAVDADPSLRFETAEELLMAIERGPWDMPAKNKRVPLASRNKLRTWQILSFISFLSNIILLLMFFYH